MTTSALSDYAARLRGFMEDCEPIRNADFSPHQLSELSQRAGCANALVGRTLKRAKARAAQGSDEEFNALALELHRLQFEHNAAYRLLCEAGGSRPDALGHWSQIPAVPASAFKELEITSVPPGERRVVFCSSGTSGREVSRHFHNAESLALYETSLWLWFRTQLMSDDPLAAGPKPRTRPTRLVILTPPGVRHSSLVHMFETIAREWSRERTPANFCGIANDDGSWSLDYERVEQALELVITEQQPVLLLGTAFNYVHLLERWSAGGWRFVLPPGSRLLETGGYKGRSRVLAKEDLHLQLCECLGLTPEAIVCEYGMSELSSQAYDTMAPSTGSGQSPAAGRGPFSFAPWARVQVISPETGREVGEGETGLIRVWDLANVWSVAAVQTEDLGVRIGDGFGLVGRAALAEPRGCSLMASHPPRG